MTSTSLWPETEDDLVPLAVFDPPSAALDTAPANWRDWLDALFPKHVTHPPAGHHATFWDHTWAIRKGVGPRPFVAIWSRGGAKSTSAELGATAVGLRGHRHYVLYVRSTQELADKSVENIAALLESKAVERYYPRHAQRQVSKFGASRGWRRNRLRTAGGFTVDAIGLDTAARGVKVEEHRPDLIILDDLDEKHDAPGTTAKKIATVTTSLLPAGSTDCAVLGIQNLITPDGIFSRLVDGRADFLADRIVSGPFPAVEGLAYEPREHPDTGARTYVITKGVASWAGQSIEQCERLLNLIGPAAFEKECQHQVWNRSEGLALRFDTQRHFADLTHAELTKLIGLGSVFAGIDFGLWRFACVLFAVDTSGIVYRVGELFSQRQGLETRAKLIHEHFSSLGVAPRVRIWGDAANPQDIMEINAAFKRGWIDEHGNRVTSPYRVGPVASDNKIRIPSFERWNDLLDRNMFKLVRSVGAGMYWKLGYTVVDGGTEMTGSRLLWEMQHLSYPVPSETKAQSQDPDDHTADGFDCGSASRYALMSYFRPGKEPPADERSAFDPEVLRQDAERAHTIKHRLQRRKNGLKPVDPHFGNY